MNTVTRTTAEQDQARSLLGYLGAVQAIIGAYPVAVPVSLDVTPYDGKVTVLLAMTDLPGLAAGLLSWAGVLTEITGKVWRLGDTARVHLSVTDHTATGMCVRVFSGVEYAPAVFGDLAPDEKRPVSLDQLRAWEADTGAGVAA